LLSRENGQSLALVKAGKLEKEIKIGTIKSKFSAIFRGADGSTSLFGSSSETLGGKKLAGKVDGILLKVSKTGSISSVVRSSAAGAIRDWQSATATNFLTGVVKSGTKIETAITKFNPHLPQLGQLDFHLPELAWLHLERKVQYLPFSNRLQP
jgi:hypothetical protein